METTHVQKLAKILKILVDIAFVCNVVALFLVPGLTVYRFDLDRVQALWNYEPSDCLYYFFHPFSFLDRPEPYVLVLTLFLLFSGVCTAVILRQGRRVLDTILVGDPFSAENAVSLRRAAVCAFLISGAALARVVFSVCFYRSPAPLLTYNALFVPIFAMAGLLCWVCSALFRQAAEMKAENDLTI